MSRPIRHSAGACILLLFLASCTGGDPSKDAAGPVPRKSLSQRINESPPGYREDAEGNWVPGADQRHWLDTRKRNPFARNQRQEKNFPVKSFNRKSWQGNRDYAAGSYDGPTDGSRFQKDSRLEGTVSREAGNQSRLPKDHPKGTYATDAARETWQGRPDTPSDAETDIRRRVYKSPDIVDWREQRRLEVSETKSLLGR